MRAVADPRAADEDTRTLQSDMMANSSRAPRAVKVALLPRMAKAATPQLNIDLPTPVVVEKLAAALKAGGYRSANQYMDILREETVVAGHVWTQALELAFRRSKRSVTRGIGAPKRAHTFELECLAAAPNGERPLDLEGPMHPVSIGIVMASWMLRGLEAATLLGGQATVDLKAGTATITLGDRHSRARLSANAYVPLRSGPHRGRLETDGCAMYTLWPIFWTLGGAWTSCRTTHSYQRASGP